MGTCLITKLKGTVSDIYLPKIGETRFKAYAGVPVTCVLNFKNYAYQIKTINSSGVENYIETTTTRFSCYGLDEYTFSEDTIVYIPNNYNDIFIIGNMTPYNDDWNIGCKIINYFVNAEIPVNINGIGKYETIFHRISTAQISYNYIFSTKLSGNFSEFANCVYCRIYLDNLTFNKNIEIFENNDKITCIELDNSRFKNYSLRGNISSLSNCINLKWLRLNNTNITGDLSSILSLSEKLTDLQISSTHISSTTQTIGQFTGLTNLTVTNNSNITGDIADILPLTNLRTLYITNSNNIYGSKSSISELTDNGLTVAWNNTITD